VCPVTFVNAKTFALKALPPIHYFYIGPSGDVSFQIRRIFFVGCLKGIRIVEQYGF
jgi:hypothetical protein